MKIALVMSYSFDQDGAVKLFENENYNAGHDEACQYMSESFEKYLNIEKEECTLLDDDNTFCDVDSGYAKVTYADGDCTEWQVLDVFDEL